MSVPIEPKFVDPDLVLTTSRLKALKAFADGEPRAPRDKRIRKDVARALWEGGWIALAARGHNHFTGYAPCVITEKGRRVLNGITRVTS